MAKRKRSDSSHLEDVDRSLYTSFCHAANAISQLYTQAQQFNKVAFQSGQRVALERVFEWIQRQHQVGHNPTVFDIMIYIKNELEALMQAEMAIVQVQSQPASITHIQQVPPAPFGRPDASGVPGLR